MEEFNDLISLPTAHKVTYDIMHSGEFLYELEQMTGIVGLLPDPHLVGQDIQSLETEKIWGVITISIGMIESDYTEN